MKIFYSQLCSSKAVNYILLLFYILLFFYILLLSSRSMAAQSVTGPARLSAGLPDTGAAESVTDTIRVHYDSIQDVRLDQIEQNLEKWIPNLKSTQDQAAQVMDSLDKSLEELRLQLRQTENENKLQAGRIVQLEEQLRQSRELSRTYMESSRTYRERLHRVLWITGSAILLLVTGLFLFLLLYSLRTRNILGRRIKGAMDGTGIALEKIRRRQKKLKKTMLEKLRASNKEMRKRMKTQEKTVRRQARKEAKEELKAARSKRK